MMRVLILFQSLLLILRNKSLMLWISLSASGVLKGFDPLLNLVLDGTIEYMRGKSAGCGSDVTLMIG